MPNVESTSSFHVYRIKTHVVHYTRIRHIASILWHAPFFHFFFLFFLGDLYISRNPSHGETPFADLSTTSLAIFLDNRSLLRLLGLGISICSKGIHTYTHVPTGTHIHIHRGRNTETYLIFSKLYISTHGKMRSGETVVNIFVFLPTLPATTAPCMLFCAIV